MKTLSAEELAAVVQAYLDRQQPRDYRLNVEPACIRREDDWWYVTVLPDREGVSSWDYSHHLTPIEDELEDREGLKVLLVPALVD